MNNGMNRGVVAITGGSGGIGRATAQKYVAAGFKVAIADLNEDAAKKTAADLNGRVSKENLLAVGLKLDVTDSDSYEAFFDAAEKELGSLTHIVLGAGVMAVGPYDEESDRALDMQLAVNLGGVIRGVKTGSKRLIANRQGRKPSGRLVVIASAASLLAPPGEATYAASKHGVYGYLKTVREETRKENIDFITIMPAVVDTPLAAGTASGAAKLLTPEDVAEIIVSESVRKKPRFELTIPGYVAPLSRFINVLPAKLRDALLRMMVPNQVKSSKQADRKEYEARFQAGE